MDHVLVSEYFVNILTIILGIIPISNGSAIHIVDHPCWSEKYPHVLKLSTPDRTFYLCAENNTNLSLWFNTIGQIIEGKFTNERDEEIFESDKEKKDPVRIIFT